MRQITPLTMEVSLHRAGQKEYSITIRLKNSGAQPVLVNERLLPWNYPQSLHMHAQSLRRYTDILVEATQREEPGKSVVPLGVGEGLDGSFSLNERFPALGEVLEDENDAVSIDWVCRLSVPVTCPDGPGGTFLIRRTRSHEGGASTEKEGPTLQMDVSLLNMGKHNYKLHVRLTNKSAASVTVGGTFPWHYTYDLPVRAMRLNDIPGVIEQSLGPERPPIRPKVKMNRGEFVEGDLELNRRFINLHNELFEHDVIIFWTCNLLSVNVSCEHGSGGAFLLQRGKEGDQAGF